MTEKWPSKGPDFNEWYRDLPAFIALLEDAKAEGFWTADFDLKYLNVRIDTRDNAWLLLVDGPDGQKERIEPQRVIDAIEKHRARFGRARPYARLAGLSE
jgi:hypothetical protein